MGFFGKALPGERHTVQARKLAIDESHATRAHADFSQRVLRVCDGEDEKAGPLE